MEQTRITEQDTSRVWPQAVKEKEGEADGKAGIEDGEKEGVNIDYGLICVTHDVMNIALMNSFPPHKYIEEVLPLFQFCIWENSVERVNKQPNVMNWIMPSKAMFKSTSWYLWLGPYLEIDFIQMKSS